MTAQTCVWIQINAVKQIHQMLFAEVTRNDTFKTLGKNWDLLAHLQRLKKNTYFRDMKAKERGILHANPQTTVLM